MISLSIPESIIKKHINYLKESGLNRNLENLKSDEFLRKLRRKQGPIYTQGHIKFMEYIIEQLQNLDKYPIEKLEDNIFICNPIELAKKIAYINNNYPEINILIRDKNNISYNKCYSELLLDAFGYESFSKISLNEYYSNELIFIKSITKRRIKAILQENAYNCSNALEALINIITEFIMTNETLKTDFIFLCNEIRNISINLFTNKEKFVNAIYELIKQTKEKIQTLSSQEIVSIMNYDIYKKKYNSWSAYDFVMELGIKVCPYCNINYITPIYGHNGSTRADIDHYYAKSLYPYLSMSIFNLIPSCKICNSSFKKAKEFTDKNISVYSQDMESLYKFTYFPSSYDNFEGKGNLEIDIEYNNKNLISKKLKNNNAIFNIKNMYQYHTDVVLSLLKKRHIYNDAYIDYLHINYPNIFNSKEEVNECLFDFNHDIKNQSLGKLKTDILKELGL